MLNPSDLKSLRGLLSDKSKPAGLIGFDGFVDDIVRLVESRSRGEYHYVRSIDSFAAKIAAAAGRSANLELVQQHRRPGGNAPLMAGSMISLGATVDFCGAVKPLNEDLFGDFRSSCRTVSAVAVPATAQALEFDDGKIMLCERSALSEVNWHNCRDAVSAALSRDPDFIACVNWTELPQMNSILWGLAGLLQMHSRKLPLFIDLADFQSRDSRELSEALHLLRDIYAEVHLGVNLSEAENLTDLLSVSGGDCQQLAESLQEKLGFHAVCVHSHKSAAVATEGSSRQIQTLHVERPQVSTGAGDHFNAGYLWAIAHGSSESSALSMAVLNSSLYVRTGKSPGITDLILLMDSMEMQPC